MGCTIPNFNLEVKIRYDISTSTPSVTIINQSTGANLSNISYWFELYTPSGTIYHAGNSFNIDAFANWQVVNIAENIPQSNGKIEFDIVSPYIVKVFAKDNFGNTCDKVYEDIICAPNGNKGKNNFGETLLSVLQKCNEGLLQITDVSNYLYKGIVGTLISNETTLVYPTPSEGSAPPNTVVSNKNAFTMPIPVNGKGHQLIRNSILLYSLPSGNEILVKYKFKNSSFEVNCGVSLCLIMCGLSKYREMLYDSDGTCSAKDETKIANLSLKISQLVLALTSPLCGFDTAKLHNEINEELLLNGCVCDCEDTGNNNVNELKCADIDIACVWDSIVELMETTPAEKAKLCELVTECVNEMTNGCSQVFMSGVVFTPTKITVNYLLSNQVISTNLGIYYKLHSSGTWILASTQPSNSTTFDINGTFTVNELYDVKVVNNCSGGASTNSAIVSGIIPEQLSACTYLNTIYTGLGSGVYAIKVDTSQVGCAKYTYQLIDGTFINSLIPCQTPVNLKIASNGILTWDGQAGDYEVSFKLKVSGTWTVFSTSAYTGTTHTVNLNASLVGGAGLYDLRVRYRCGVSNFSLPIYCDLLASPSTNICKSAGDFISFNETTGLLQWFGGVSSGNYTINVMKLGASLGAPLSFSVNGTTSVISIDYGNILASITKGDILTFSIRQDCGGGSVSDVASYTYKMIGALIACPSFTPGFGWSSIVNNVVRINIGGSDPLPPEILFTQIELRVNGVRAGMSFLVLDGAIESQVKSTIPIKTGDTIEVRYRSFGNFNDYNVGTFTSWSNFFGTSAVCLDKIYVGSPLVPFGTNFSNVAQSNPDNLFFSLTSDSVLIIQGTIQGSSGTTNVFTLPVGYRPSPGTYFRGFAFSFISSTTTIQPLPFIITDNGILSFTNIAHPLNTPITFNNSFRI
jgi:hypothetical protein